MWVLAGLAAGWLAENLRTRGGYGLITDMVVGLGGSIAAGWMALALRALRGGKRDRRSAVVLA